ncbi:small GTP-binding protein [Lutibacter sp. Hel_I_33_5]|uniref:Rab family GTPase n=1 Tax=Lutibacter sp. Hel_I_33_5 TaxID=1566289 RepID=UPI00119DD6E0|nr:Rab family GTPase [Lutibacter sp. Hel_I_33_5]TVZ57081.1 small GTP-binding protein [Lutibacter sp. Hel_I_33_5]
MTAKKVLLVGNFGVGKTSLIRRFVKSVFSEDYISTIGVRVSTKIVEHKNDTIKLLIWDVSGTIGKEKLPKSYFLGASAAMYVFDLSRKETYENIKENLDSVKELSGLKNIIVAGNKKDLVTTKELNKIKDLVNVDFFTSAKEDENVEDAFQLLAEKSLK